MPSAINTFTTPGQVFHTNAFALDSRFQKKCEKIEKLNSQKVLIEKVIKIAAVLSLAIFPLAIVLWLIYWHFSTKYEALLEKEIDKEFHSAKIQIPHDLRRNHSYTIDGQTLVLEKMQDADKLTNKILATLSTTDPVQQYNFLNFSHQGLSALPLLFCYQKMGEGYWAKGGDYTRNCEVIKSGENLQLRSLDTISILQGTNVIKTFKTQTTLDLKTRAVTLVILS